MSAPGGREGEGGDDDDEEEDECDEFVSPRASLDDVLDAAVAGGLEEAGGSSSSLPEVHVPRERAGSVALQSLLQRLSLSEACTGGGDEGGGGGGGGWVSPGPEGLLQRPFGEAVALLRRLEETRAPAEKVKLITQCFGAIEAAAAGVAADGQPAGPADDGGTLSADVVLPALQFVLVRLGPEPRRAACDTPPE